MKKILIISYYYPPLLDVGSLRALAFSKYLPSHGWQPYVLSVKNPDKSYCIIGNENPPENVKVFYCRSLFNLAKVTGKANGLLDRVLKIFGVQMQTNLVQDFFCIPDIFVGWIPLTFIKGLRIIRENNIDAIYVSCKPFSSAIIGVFLKKITQKPLILDFRDPVSFPVYCFKHLSRRFAFLTIRKIEEYTLKNADTLIVTTDETKEMYLSICPYLKEKICRIYNGYFPEYLPKSSTNSFKKFTIVYTGNFYYDLVPSNAFFMALQKAIVEQMVPREKIQFLYVGGLSKNDNWLETLASKYHLQDVIVTRGRVSREESMKNVYRSSMLLLRIVPPMISTKLYEGLATGIPILATINEGEVADLIRRYSKNSYVITSNNVDDIANAIKDAYSKWEKGELEKSTNEEFLQNFNKRTLTKQFAQILEEVHEASKSGK